MKKYLLFLASCIVVVLSIQAQDQPSNQGQQSCDQDKASVHVQTTFGGFGNYHANPWSIAEPLGPHGNTPRPVKPLIFQPIFPGVLLPDLVLFGPDPGFGYGSLYLGGGNGPISLANLVGPSIRGYRGNTSRPIKPSVPSKPTSTGGSGTGIKISFESASGTGDSDALQSGCQSSGQPEDGKVSSDVENMMGQSVGLAITQVHGDLNQDNAIDVSDVTLLINRIMNGDIDGLDIDALDSNHDGKLDVSDVTALIGRVMQCDVPPVEKMQSAKQSVSR